MTDTVRKRFFGDTVVAQRYTGEALDLLEIVKNKAQLGGLQQLQQRRVLGNGVELFAVTRFGQTEIRVDTSKMVEKKVGGLREYCTWEGDTEAFTEPLRGVHVFGPHMIGRKIMHMGGRLDESYFRYVADLPGGGSVNRTNEYDVDKVVTYDMNTGASIGEITVPTVAHYPEAFAPSAKGHFPMMGIFPDVKAKMFYGTNPVQIMNPYPGMYRAIKWDDVDVTGDVTHEDVPLWPPGSSASSGTTHWPYLFYASTGTLYDAIARPNTPFVTCTGVGICSTPYKNNGINIHSPSDGSSASSISTGSYTPSGAQNGEANGFVWARGTSSGDMLAKLGTAPDGPFMLKKVGVVTDEVDFPEVPTSNKDYSYASHGVLQNDGKTAWYIDVDGASFTLHRSIDGGDWEPIEVEGGFGSFTQATLDNIHHAYQFNNLQSKDAIGIGNGDERNILHDSVTDAVAVVKADLTGAWIFNAKDCMNVIMPPFYYPFKLVPMDLADTAGDNQGNGGGGFYRYAVPVQFHNGFLTIRFAEWTDYVDDNLGGNRVQFLSFTGAAYKIGRTLQTKATAAV